MKRAARWLLPVVLAVCVGPSFRAVQADKATSAPARLNILWIGVDQLRFDTPGCNGNPICRTPSIDRLDQLGLAENTIVIFESDHGDMAGSHGLFDKGFMYQEAFRIPLIVRWPARCHPGRTCDELVYNMDIFSTILDALGQLDDKDPSHNPSPPRGRGQGEGETQAIPNPPPTPP